MIYVASLAWLLINGRTGLRYSADTTDTILLWHPWLPVAVAMIPLLFAPRRRAEALEPARPAPPWLAATLVAAAVGFAVVLKLLGPAEPVYTGAKLLLLVVVPLVALVVARRSWEPTVRHTDIAPGWLWLACGLWIAVSYLTPLAPRSVNLPYDLTTVVLILLVGFAINAVVEEVFYRKVLIDRLLDWIGPWPAIIASSLLWSAWHIAIQGSDRVDLDLAQVIMNQGVTGLLLGLLWVRGRSLAPLLIIHGLVNAAPILLGLLR